MIVYYKRASNIGQQQLRVFPITAQDLEETVQ